MTEFNTALFGTNTTDWRKEVKKFFSILGPWSCYDNYTNNLTKAHLKEQVDEAANADVIVFAITDEDYSIQSLTSIGLVINAIIASQQYGVFYIAPSIKKELMEANPVMGKESIEARLAILEFLQKYRRDCIFLVDEIKDIGHAILDAYNLLELNKKTQSKWGNL